jgi:hypothetical protein
VRLQVWLRRSVLLIVALGLLIAVGGGLIGGQVVGAGRAVYIKPRAHDDLTVVRPRQISPLEHRLSFRAVRYRRYGGRIATAVASARVHGCVPSCPLSRVVWRSARLRFDDLVRCGGRLTYGRMSYVLGGPATEGIERRGSFDIRPTTEIGRPAC